MPKKTIAPETPEEPEQPDRDPASLGGQARAESLTPEQRKDIAQKAAIERWAKAGKLVKATHGSPDRPLRIGEIEIPCYVLADGRRVIMMTGLLGALGMSLGGGSKYSRNTGEDRLARFTNSKAIKPFITNDLQARTLPIEFVTPKGSRANGYEATVLADLCDAILAARQAGELNRQQTHIAERAEILVRGFARVGIIALVDEATGYQEKRDREALEAILNRFLRQELAAWAKRFPDEFYRHIFRLRGWPWKAIGEGSPKGPQVIAHYTKDLVYARLAPGILTQLQERMPRNDSGRPKGKLHQLFTEDVGHPALAQHLWAVIGFMRVCGTWDQLMGMLNVAYPKRGDTLAMPFMADPTVNGDNG